MWFYVGDTQVVRENENVTLGCDATGYPKPHIVWRREDGEDIVIGGKKVAKTLKFTNFHLYNIGFLR